MLFMTPEEVLDEISACGILMQQNQKKKMNRFQLIAKHNKQWEIINNKINYEDN